MGDSLSYADDCEREEYYGSEAYKKDKAQAAEWNELARVAGSLSASTLTVDELRFVLFKVKRVDVSFTNRFPYPDADILYLRGIVARAIKKEFGA